MNEHNTPTNLRPLIDADPIIYRAGFAADGQLVKEYIEQYPDATRDEAKAALDGVDYRGIAFHNADAMLDSIIARFDYNPYIYLSGSGNFREAVATIKPYKGNRDPLHKPKYYKELRQRLLDRWQAILVDGQEADDAVAQEQWAAKGGTVICTIDKDLDQVPGWHYNYVKETLYYVPLKEANNFFFAQMLIGDTSDNIPGINRVGPKTTEKLLAECNYETDRIRERVKELYRNQYGDVWEAAYAEVGELLWMRRIKDKECPLL